MQGDVLEERMIEALRDSKLVRYILMDAVLDECDESAIRSLTKVAHTISYDNEGIFFETEKGERVECPNFATNISENGIWLSSQLPDIPFDIEQSGNVRKSSEAEAAYICVIVSLVLNKGEFNQELDELIKNYDFKEMDGKEGEGKKNFGDLLAEWQSLQSTVINVCVSAAKYRISDFKKDIEKFLRDGIPNDVVVELRGLDVIIKNFNREYSTGKLSPLNIKKLTKIDILKLLEEKETKIKDQVEASKVGVLWKALKLSSEYIDPVKKKQLARLANSAIDELYKENPKYVQLIGEKQLVCDKWRRRFYNYEKMSVRRREVLKYLNTESKEEYTLPPKL